MYQVQIYDDAGNDVTFNRLELAAPEDSDPLNLLIHAEEEIEHQTKRTPSFKDTCKYLGL